LQRTYGSIRVQEQRFAIRKRSRVSDFQGKALKFNRFPVYVAIGEMRVAAVEGRAPESRNGRSIVGTAYSWEQMPTGFSMGGKDVKHLMHQRPG
jgi:hypothetical protein